MRRIVFYSWQSDKPNACNRGLIQGALEEAAAAIIADDTLSIEPVIDRDTQGAPGAPDIASTIFAKISAADIFVADVSITIGAKGARATPNPNVLIELGYALKALGPERVIFVFNSTFGKVEDLPFDLKMRRVLVYEMPEEAVERAPERKKLASQLCGAIRAILAHIPQVKVVPEITIPAVTAIETNQGNRKIILRRNLADILKKLDDLEPRKARDGGTAAELIDALTKTQEAVAEFSKIVEMIAVMGDVDAAIEVQRWFGKIFQRYELPERFSGKYNEADQDYFKFIGHEMFITLVAFMMREQNWEMLHLTLDEPIPMHIRNHGPGNVDWYYASKHLLLLIQESSKRRRLCVHGDLLHERHADTGGLATIAPLEDLMNADFL